MGDDSVQVKQAQSVWARCSDTESRVGSPEKSKLSELCFGSHWLTWEGTGSEQGLSCAMNPIQQGAGTKVLLPAQGIVPGCPAVQKGIAPC